MAPPGGSKRKRPDRTYSQDTTDAQGNTRPSPHRPQNLNLAQQNQQYNGGSGNAGGGRGNRRGSRGGRGGRDGGSPMSTPARASPRAAEEGRASPTMTRAPPPPPAQERPQSRQDAAPVQKPAAPYNYQYVTDENKAAWRTSGKKAVVDAATQAQEQGDLLTLSMTFQELVRAGLDNRIAPQDAGDAVKDVLAAAGEERSDSASLFLDSLSILAEADAAGPALRNILTATGIEAKQMRNELDTGLLAKTGLVRQSFFKMGTRHATNQLYRQSNYNLLREESEGYSKLMTEYFTTTNSEPPSGETAADTFQRVKALIGAFDLDVGRVLDVTLDVFANLLVKHYRFFIKFLRVSSWWPEEKPFTGHEWTTLGIESLPRWARPDCSAWTASEDDKEQLASKKEARDKIFWDRARQVGLEAFFELGGRRITSGLDELGELEKAIKVEKEEEKAAAIAAEKSGDKKKMLVDEKTEADFNREWIAITKMLPPPGNRVAAQLLGFKLRFYASSARDPHDVLPENLIYLAALLIKIGFISLRDLYPHLYPLDKDMAEVKEKLTKEKAEREKRGRPGGGALNALAMAGALADDTLPMSSRLREVENSRASSAKPDEKTTTPKPEEDEKEKLPEPADQKIQLLKSLLTIGAIPESLFILGKFPWLADLHPEIPQYLHRILNYCIDKVYEPLRPVVDRDTVCTAKCPVFDQSGPAKGEFRFGEPPNRKVLRWAQLEKNDAGDGGVDYRFYWDDWADNVPVCQTVDDVFTLCNSFLKYSGVKIGQDATILIKLARIGKASLSEDGSDANFARWKELMRTLLVPALSMTKGNPGVVNEVWDLLKLFSTQTRYTIYQEWYTGPTSRSPAITSAFDQSKAETKDVLKRISRTNTKQMARALAKVAYASPGVVFQVALNQIESYDNLVDVVVECARYFTYLGYDVLTWTLMSSLGGQGRDRVQKDGMLTSPWLKALSHFAGRVFKRYSVMNATPILQYVAHQLQLGNATDLEVLEQIINSMAGIRSDMNFNEAQTQAMAGGELLQAQTLEQLQDRRHEAKNSSRRLMKALVEPGLAGPLLVSIARERQNYIFSETAETAPLKVIGNNMDKLHEVFFQFLDTLRTNLSAKDFDAVIPDAASLIADFGIDTGIAFATVRASVSQAVAEVDAAAREKQGGEKRKSIGEKPVTNGDVEMADAAAETKSEVNGTANEAAEPEAEVKEEQGADSKDTVEVSTPGLTPAPPTPDSDEPWHPVMKELMDNVRPVLPEAFEERNSLSFYATFWQLSLADLLVPSKSYEDEIKRQQDKVSLLSSDRSDLTVVGLKKKEAKKKEIYELQDRLRAEMKSQIQTYQHIRSRLQREKDHWFATHPLALTPELHGNIIQECFMPRILLSSIDAQYSYKMLMFLHSSGTPGFRTMFLIDKLLGKQIPAVIFMCTAREAENLGRFLNELLKELRRWHADPAVYEKMAYGPKKDLPGFGRKFGSESKVPEVFLSYEDFRRLLYKWHLGLTHAIKACFTSGEYMRIRNAVNVVKAAHQSFPLINWSGYAMIECINDISANDHRQDLKLAAMSLLGDIKKREKDWISPQAFRVHDMNAQQKGGPQGENATPQPGQGESATPQPMNPAATEFRPGQTTNGATSATANGSVDAEDGEVDENRDGTKKSIPVAGGQNESQKAESAVAPAAAKGVESLPATPAPGTPASLPERPPPVRTSSDAKLGTMAATSGPPPRPDLGRAASGQNMHGRPPHALPSRPDTRPLRPGTMPDRQDRMRHDTRPPPNHEFGRLDRPGDIARENFHNDRRDRSPRPRARGTTPERAQMERDRRDPQWAGGRDGWEHPDDRGMRPPPRDVRPSARGPPPSWNDNQRSRPPSFDGANQSGRPPFDFDSPNSTMPADGRDWRGPAGSMPPPSSGPYQRPERGGPPMHSDRNPNLPGPAVDRSTVNPARAALIEEDMSRRDGPGFRPERDTRRDTRVPRTHSPRRGDERPTAPPYPPREDPRDERGPPERMAPSYPPNGPVRDRREDPNAPAPTGPRSNRGNEYTDVAPNGPAGRGRELFQPTAPPRPPIDPNHGRLNNDFPSRAPQESSYGRLNGADIPSGPRGRGGQGRGGRNFTTPGHITRPSDAGAGQPSSVPPSPMSDRGSGAPTGPNVERSRNEHRDSVSHREGTSHRESASFDRAGPQTPSSNADGPETTGIHPSRLRQFNDRPTINTDMPAPSNSSHPPPSGPRSAGPHLSHSTHQHRQSGSIPPSPTSRTAPTNLSGPAPAPPPERERERRPEDKRFAGIQNVLQQGGSSFDRGNGGGSTGSAGLDRGASIRGRASRGAGAGGLGTGSPSGSAPGTPMGVHAERESGSTRDRDREGGRDRERDRDTHSHSGRDRDRDRSDRADRGDLLDDRTAGSTSGRRERERDRERRSGATDAEHSTHRSSRHGSRDRGSSRRGTHTHSSAHGAAEQSSAVAAPERPPRTESSHGHRSARHESQSQGQSHHSHHERSGSTREPRERRGRESGGGGGWGGDDDVMGQGQGGQSGGGGMQLRRGGPPQVEGGEGYFRTSRGERGEEREGQGQGQREGLRRERPERGAHKRGPPGSEGGAGGDSKRVRRSMG